jgi:TatD DNase family protein
MEKTKVIKLFDTHAHYDDKAYGGNADALITRILSDSENAVAGFMAVGCSMRTIPKSLAIAEKYGTVYASAGIHPHYVKQVTPDYLLRLEEWAKHSKVRAIGETGLDYHYDGYCRETQIRVFREQLALAARLNLPVIVHSRDSTADTLEILREFRPKGVMHCYSGSVDTARELVKLGILISFTGVITFRNARKAAEVCREIPDESIMLETDCPYMAPEPFRGKLCDSSMAWKSAAKIAEIRGVSVEKMVEICNNNAKKFFNIEF